MMKIKRKLELKKNTDKSFCLVKVYAVIFFFFFIYEFFKIFS